MPYFVTSAPVMLSQVQVPGATPTATPDCMTPAHLQVLRKADLGRLYGEVPAYPYP